MSFTYDASNDIGKVRLLIGDTLNTSTQPAIFSDEEIVNGFLALNPDVRYAAARALDTIATSTVMVQSVMKILDIETSADKVAEALRAQAESLRTETDEDGSFEFADTVGNSFAERDRIFKQFLRGAI